MMQRTGILSRRSFSMVEVIVAAVLFATASAGIFATISYTNHSSGSSGSDARVKAAFLAKMVLDQLNKEVNSSTWSSGLLSVGDHTWPAVAGFTGYTATYKVTEPDGPGGARKVVVNVDW
jgi:Tfp pilus assembly protein PilV